jgi:hypothetical protein
MHTLSRAVTAHWFTTPADFNALRAHWRNLVTSDRRHTLTAEHHLLYGALLGRDWRRGFSWPRRLPPEGFAYWRLFTVLARVHSRYWDDKLLEPFDGHVTREQLAALRRWLSRVDETSYPPEQYAPGVFPFDAYAAPIPAQSQPAAHA